MMRQTAGRRRSLGMTMVELSISLGVGVVLLGVMLAAFVQSERVADSQTAKAGAIEEATTIAEAVTTILSRSQDPAAVGLASDSAFLNHRLTVLAPAERDAVGWTECVIENQSDEKAESRAVMIRRRAVGTDGQSAEFETRSAGVADDKYSSEITFEYADAFDEAVDPVLVREHDGRPAYVRFSISVRDRDGEMTEPITLTSGVALP